MSVKYKNDRAGIRHVFVLAGEMVIIPTYNKTNTVTGSTRLIARYLPPAASQLLYTYLTLIRPIVNHFAARLYKPHVAAMYKSYLFCIGPKGRLSDQGTSPYNILSAGFMRVYGLPLDSRSFRQIVIAFSHRFGHDLTTKNSRLLTSMHMQAGHSAKTGNTSYAVNDHQFTCLTRDELYDYHHSSLCWHVFSGVAGVDASHGLHMIEAIQDTECVPCLDDQKLREALDHVAGRHGTPFRSQDQLTAVTAVAQATKDLVVVMPTGSGKTLLYELPAHAEGELYVTVVIVPVNSLIGDLARRFAEEGVWFTVWNPFDPFVCAGITLVHIDKIPSTAQSFHAMLNHLAARGRLWRIVIEEIHMVLSDSDFRPSFSDIMGLRKTCIGPHRQEYTVPVIGLTATLPETNQQELCKQTSIPFSFLRYATDRANLKYIQRMPRGKWSCEDAAEVVSAEIAHWEHANLDHDTRDAKVIVFCYSRDDVTALSRFLVSTGVANVFTHSGDNNVVLGRQTDLPAGLSGQ
ncbi:P-loop containing nucleoside triphosphate hydrolase protein [Entophlyctis helioformis]|nr:P-loop containing nucleoside triphosphate hydrolase protein [Entophlyctis helioformis]